MVIEPLAVGIARKITRVLDRRESPEARRARSSRFLLAAARPAQ
jgi:hypothetical protein